jgi:hypothetical protein
MYSPSGLNETHEIVFTAALAGNFFPLEDWGKAPAAIIARDIGILDDTVELSFGGGVRVDDARCPPPTAAVAEAAIKKAI